MSEDTYTREQLAELLGWRVKSVGEQLSRTRKAASKGEDITARPYRWLPLPDERDRWTAAVIAYYLEDRARRQDDHRARIPAGRIVDVDGQPRMLVRTQHELTRDQLAGTLWAWRIDNGMAPLPRGQEKLMAAVRESLLRRGIPSASLITAGVKQVRAAVNTLWPEEA